MTAPREVLRVTVLTFLGKAAGFVVPLFVAAWFGAGPNTDAFFFAYGAMLFVSGAFGPVLDVVVPFVADARKREAGAGAFMGGLLGAGTGAFLLGLAAFLIVLVPLVPWLTGFPPQGVTLARVVLLEIAPLTLLLLWTSALSGYLNAHRLFAWPALSPAIRAAVNLAVIGLLKERLGIHALAIGYVAGEAVRLAALAAIVRASAPFPVHISFRFDDSLKAFFRTTAFAVAAMVWVLANQLVDTTMASWLGPGNVSVLHYAGTLYMIPMSLLAGGLMTVVLAQWSDRFGPDHRTGFKAETRRVARATFAWTLPCTLGLIVLSGPLTALLFGHGAFGEAGVDAVRWVWVAYLAGVPAQASAQLSAKALLVLHDTRAFARGAVGALVLNAVGNVVLMRWFGVVGLACSTSATAMFSAWYFRHALRTALGPGKA
jgi:putative peptidoglycan lipid II flippase